MATRNPRYQVQEASVMPLSVAHVKRFSGSWPANVAGPASASAPRLLDQVHTLEPRSYAARVLRTTGSRPRPQAHVWPGGESGACIVLGHPQFSHS